MRNPPVPGGHVTILHNARLPGGRLVDITMTDGIVTGIHDATATTPTGEIIDAGGGLVIGAPAEPHAHLDKALSADLVPNPSGDLLGAIAAWGANTHARTTAEIAARARAAVLAAVAHGTTAIRSHVDVHSEIGLRALDALVTVRAELADIAHIELVALAGFPLTGAAGSDHRRLLAEAMDHGADLVGGCPHLEEDSEGMIEHVLALASDRGTGLDLHVDETLDPDIRTLDLLARAVMIGGFVGPVTASHCVSLGMRSSAEQRSAAELVAAAGISVVTLPQTNLYLQGRGVTPPPRGLTAIGALIDAGVVVAGGGDNVQDPFNVVGRNDPFETASLLVMAGHLPVDVALDAVSGAARQVLGLAPAGPEIGHVADLLVVRSRSTRQAVAEAGADRIVIRGGRVVVETVTDRRWSRRLEG